jgi:hypothetical protein
MLTMPIFARRSFPTSSFVHLIPRPSPFQRPARKFLWLGSQRGLPATPNRMREKMTTVRERQVYLKSGPVTLFAADNPKDFHGFPRRGILVTTITMMKIVTARVP